MVTAANRAQDIRLAIFDVDGVLTDGGLYLDDNGMETKRFHARDGLGLRLLQSAGIQLAIITGRTSGVVAHRSSELDIEHVYQGRKDKLPAFEELCAETGISADQVAYMGDDIVDLPIMRRVGLALTVPGACEEIAAIAHWVSTATGGNGAAREACEFILRAQGQYSSAIERYLV
jgi:3-deoxy-D-manno-octulosonate 8-phosphate phosphatase (KDO 8-P phosphatase)